MASSPKTLRRYGALLLALATFVAGASQQGATGEDAPQGVVADPNAGDQPTSEQEDATPPTDPFEGAPAPSPAGEAAKQTFDQLTQEWTTLIGSIKSADETRGKAVGEERAKIDSQISSLRNDLDGLINKITDAGVAVYKAAPQAYPDVNATVLAIVQYHLVGDAQGDGGDQYERALGPIKTLLEAGGGTEWPYLYAWGGVAAYCVNDFELADQYFKQAQAAGALGAAPPSRNPSDPRLRLWESATQFQKGLPTIRNVWAKEQELRAAEATADNLPRVKFTMANGEIVIELFENEAPQAAANFITLVKQGFYDGVVFHRVLPGFMAQGGDPTGSGTGGPGYCIRCECFQPNLRKHFRGSLSMAHAGRDTGGSQFFLTFVPTSFLDGRHTVFGRVVEGMDIAAGIKRRDPDAPNSAPDKILKAEVLRDRGHAYEFARLPGR